MRIIYIADDGTQFDDEYECKDYEWKLNHPNINNIHVFDKDCHMLHDILSEDTYNQAATIAVCTTDQVKDIQDLAKYTGFCAYDNINEVGVWVYNTHTERFCPANVVVEV